MADTDHEAQWRKEFEMDGQLAVHNVVFNRHGYYDEPKNISPSGGFAKRKNNAKLATTPHSGIRNGLSGLPLRLLSLL